MSIAQQSLVRIHGDTSHLPLINPDLYRLKKMMTTVYPFGQEKLSLLNMQLKS